MQSELELEYFVRTRLDEHEQSVVEQQRRREAALAAGQHSGGHDAGRPVAFRPPWAAVLRWLGGPVTVHHPAL